MVYNKYILVMGFISYIVYRMHVILNTNGFVIDFIITVYQTQYSIGRAWERLLGTRLKGEYPCLYRWTKQVGPYRM